MGNKAKLLLGFPFATANYGAMTFQGSVFSPGRRGYKSETLVLCLIPKLLEDRRVIVDIAHLDGDSGAGLHPGHAQCMHHQEVGWRLLQKESKITLSNLGFTDIYRRRWHILNKTNLKVEYFACVNDTGMMVDVETEVFVAPGDIIKER